MTQKRDHYIKLADEHLDEFNRFRSLKHVAKEEIELIAQDFCNNMPVWQIKSIWVLSDGCFNLLRSTYPDLFVLKNTQCLICGGGFKVTNIHRKVCSTECQVVNKHRPYLEKVMSYCFNQGMTKNQMMKMFQNALNKLGYIHDVRSTMP